MKYLIALYLLPVTVIAQETSTTTVPWYEDVPLKLGEWAADVDGFLSGPAIIGLAAVLEVVFRLIKSEKPLGILHGVRAILRGVEKILEIVISGMDKVLPQRTKE